MKAAEFKELSNKTSQELETQIKEMKTELFNLRFQLATGQLENTAAIKDCKRDIARVKTVLRMREIAAQA